jgi:hypothetical protein
MSAGEGWWLWLHEESEGQHAPQNHTPALGGARGTPEAARCMRPWLHAFAQYVC